MKTHILNVLLLIFFCCSCSEEDSSDDSGPQTNDITISIDEYPEDNSFLAEISSNLSGDVTYSLLNQSEESSLTIIGNSLLVDNGLAFDYENTETITALIEANNNEDTELIIVTIEINNIDDIYYFLSSSKTAYEDAAPNTWVEITADEYFDLKDNLEDVNESGSASDQNGGTGFPLGVSSLLTFANDNGITIPENNYLFAFTYRTSAGTNLDQARVKISSSAVDSNYEDLGDTLPSHDAGLNYFVIKANEVKSSAESYLAVSGVYVGFYSDISTYQFRYSNANVDLNNLPYTSYGLALYQGLSTSVKQWD